MAIMSVSARRCIPILVSILAALSLASASPTPAELVPRACTTNRPINFSQLKRAAPDENFNGGIFALSRDGGRDSNTIETVVTFSFIPEDATGCQLQLTIPKLPAPHIPDGFANGTGTQSDVWLIKNPPWDDPTNINFALEYNWNNPPEKDQFVSTTIFPAGPTTDSRFQTFLWSGTCTKTMSFQFELSDWQQGSGDVRFFTPLRSKPFRDPIEFTMVFNC